MENYDTNEINGIIDREIFRNVFRSVKSSSTNGITEIAGILIGKKQDDLTIHYDSIPAMKSGYTEKQIQEKFGDVPGISGMVDLPIEEISRCFGSPHIEAGIIHTHPAEVGVYLGQQSDEDKEAGFRLYEKLATTFGRKDYHYTSSLFIPRPDSRMVWNIFVGHLTDISRHGNELESIFIDSLRANRDEKFTLDDKTSSFKEILGKSGRDWSKEGLEKMMEEEPLELVYEAFDNFVLKNKAEDLLKFCNMNVKVLGDEVRYRKLTAPQQSEIIEWFDKSHSDLRWELAEERLVDIYYRTGYFSPSVHIDMYRKGKDDEIECGWINVLFEGNELIHPKCIEFRKQYKKKFGREYVTVFDPKPTIGTGEREREDYQHYRKKMFRDFAMERIKQATNI
jgi:hypothetical protein